MFFYLKRDKRIRKFFKKNEMFYIILQFLQRNEIQISIDKRSFFFNRLARLFETNYFVKMRNYCLLTRGARVVYKSFRISRQQLRLFAANGYLHGLHKR